MVLEASFDGNTATGTWSLRQKSNDSQGRLENDQKVIGKATDADYHPRGEPGACRLIVSAIR